MSVNTTPESESDAFRDVMMAARSQPGRRELAHQSPGRAITQAETALAEAMMAIYATGAKGPDALAQGLAERGVTAPVSGRTDWDAALISEELKALNDSFDAAYAETGIGA